MARIRQSTTGTFEDLSFRSTCLIFVEEGVKRVVSGGAEVLVGEPGDVLVFTGNATATITNRVVEAEIYSATVIAYPDSVIAAVFGPVPPSPPVQLVSSADSRVFSALEPAWEAWRADLPPAVLDHRLVEPLQWLAAEGRVIGPRAPGPAEQIRTLIETDLSHPWRAEDAARHLAMSEATLRRHLSRSGHTFSRLLTTTRLERGLALLQTTELPISEVGSMCGFATPSHFSEAFKARFGLPPSGIRARAMDDIL